MSDAIAGHAWLHPGSWARLDVRSLQDCGGDREKWRRPWKDQNVRDEVVRRIEEHAHAYMEHVRTIACLGLKFDGTVLVVSIDSVFADFMTPSDAGKPDAPTFYRRVDSEHLLAIASFLTKESDDAE